MDRHNSKGYRPSFLQSLRSLFLAVVLGLGLSLLLLGSMRVGAQSLRTPGNPAPFPTPNSQNVPQTATVGIEYDEPIDPATVSTQTFAVHAMQGGQLLGDYSVTLGNIVLDPTRLFFPGEMVMASATTGTLSAIDGTGPFTPTVWQFRAEVTEDEGSYTQGFQTLGNINSLNLALGDVDLDGDLDIVVANDHQPNEIWLNQGGLQGGLPGYFVDSGQRLGNDSTWAMLLGDLDSDGDLDVLEVNTGVERRVWFNAGGRQGGDLGDYVDSGQSLGISNSRNGALGDVDGDGDLDALIANEGAPNELFLNNGLGDFSEGSTSFGGDRATLAVSLNDLDRDGDLDAFIANSAEPDEVWMNDGHGVFVDSGQSLGNYVSHSLAMGDLDGDGDIDAYTGSNYGQGDRVWLNQGGIQGGTEGEFVDSGQSLGAAKTQGVKLGDVDADGDLDAFTFHRLEPVNTLWLNDGSAAFSDSGITFAVSPARQGDLGDLNGDGDLDIVIPNELGFGEANTIWFNNQSTTLIDVLHVNSVLENSPITLTGGIVDGDIDDGHLLFVYWGDGVTSTYRYPAGTMRFTETHVYADDNPSLTPADPNLMRVELIDNDLNRDVYTSTIIVSNTAPVLTGISLTHALEENGQLSIAGVISDASSLDTFLLVVYWGDGEGNVYDYPAGTTTFSETHVYLDDNPTGTPSDTYTVGLVLIDDDTGWAEAEALVTVFNMAPDVAIEADPDPKLNRPVQFTAVFTDVGSQDTHEITWDFGDGEVATGTITATHTYTATGLYTVTLTVIDDDTGLGRGLMQVSIEEYNSFLPLLQRGEGGPVSGLIFSNIVPFSGLVLFPVGFAWIARRGRKN